MTPYQWCGVVAALYLLVVGAGCVGSALVSRLTSPGHISWAPVKTSPALSPDLEVTTLTLEPPGSPSEM